MKHNNLLWAIALFALPSLGFAQLSEVENPKFKEHPVPENAFESVKDKSLNKREVEGWYDYVGVAGDNGERYTYFTGVMLWPDSLPVLIFEDGPSHIGTFGFGMVFDPTSFYYVDPEAYTRFTNYSVDSVLFFYKYKNYDGATDELLINYFDQSDIAPVQFGQGATAVPSRTVDYDPATNSVENPTKTETVELTQADNTEDFYSTEFASFINGAVQLPVEMDITPVSGTPNSNLFAMTVQYVPANTNYSMGDTINHADSLNPTSKLNAFSPLVTRGDGAATNADASFNHGLFLFANQRYSTRSQEWFYPANAPGANKQFNRVLFYINGKNLDVDEKNAMGYGIGKAYPNPATSDNLRIGFSIGNSEVVTIELMDLSGKVIKTVTNKRFTPGEHIVELDITDLNKGMYLYKMTAGDYTGSKKVVVQ
jgi:hypothetical protein